MIFNIELLDIIKGDIVLLKNDYSLNSKEEIRCKKTNNYGLKNCSDFFKKNDICVIHNIIWEKYLIKNILDKRYYPEIIEVYLFDIEKILNKNILDKK